MTDPQGQLLVVVGILFDAQRDGIGLIRRET